ncbi:MAG TPA: hypothetical protein VMF69_28225 [Gemmataceae bacterium]|nr:hypothetical protein [Gemmataceae bacterium]
MTASSSIFFEIELPNATTWFYFSALLAVALFFKFNRLLSIRNFDVLSLFLPMPGFLLLAQAGVSPFWGYLGLLAASGYFLLRCLFDLTLVQRPALSPNLNFGGLVWLAGALFISLIAIAARHPNAQDNPSEEPRKQRESAPETIDPMRRLEKVIRQQAPAEVDQELLALGVERGLTVLCHLCIAVGLILIGWRHFEDLHAGMAAATFYLLLPYTYLLMPRTLLGVGRWDHAWPMALMIWMVLFFRRPALAGFFLGLAAGTVFFPVLVLPLWLNFYQRGGARRFGLSFVLSAGLCLAAIGLILWINGALPPTLLSGWKLSAWLPWRPPDAAMGGLWQGRSSHWVYRLPIFLVYVAFVFTTTFWPAPKNLAHVIALTAAVLLGIQFWYADQGGVYILWYLPLLLLLVFRPNLSACQPQPPGHDWLARLGRRLMLLVRRSLRLLRPPRSHPQATRLLS